MSQGEIKSWPPPRQHLQSHRKSDVRLNSRRYFDRQELPRQCLPPKADVARGWSSRPQRKKPPRPDRDKAIPALAKSTYIVEEKWKKPGPGFVRRFPRRVALARTTL